MSSSSSSLPADECVSCKTTECFCQIYRPVAVYDAPPPGGVLDLNAPIYLIPLSEQQDMTYYKFYEVFGALTEGWLYPVIGGDSPANNNSDARLYYDSYLEQWMMTYFRLAISPDYDITAGTFVFYEFVNCVDGCDGLLYIDTCGTHVILLECADVTPSSQSSSSISPASSISPSSSSSSLSSISISSVSSVSSSLSSSSSTSSSSSLPSLSSSSSSSVVPSSSSSQHSSSSVYTGPWCNYVWDQECVDGVWGTLIEGYSGCGFGINSKACTDLDISCPIGEQCVEYRYTAMGEPCRPGDPCNDFAGAWVQFAQSFTSEAGSCCSGSSSASSISSSSDVSSSSASPSWTTTGWYCTRKDDYVNTDCTGGISSTTTSCDYWTYDPAGCHTGIGSYITVLSGPHATSGCDGNC